jgi:hypothetical protein
MRVAISALEASRAAPPLSRVLAFEDSRVLWSGLRVQGCPSSIGSEPCSCLLVWVRECRVVLAKFFKILDLLYIYTYTYIFF